MLITGCALQCDVPTNPLLINGNEAKRLRKVMFTTGRMPRAWKVLAGNSVFVIGSRLETPNGAALSHR